MVLTGAFCEQPPLGLIKSLELAGCYIVDDDLHARQSLARWATCPRNGDPLRNLAAAFLHHSGVDRREVRAERAEKGSIWSAP